MACQKVCKQGWDNAMRQSKCQHTGKASSLHLFPTIFEAIKTLSGHRALHCDKHHFCAKRTVNTHSESGKIPIISFLTSQELLG